MSDALGAAPRLSIVAPMYNEADGIDQFVTQLSSAYAAIASAGIPTDAVEVIAVNDGSTDATAERLAALARDGRLRVVTHERNRGLGAALWTGFEAARSDVIVTVDADCTYHLSGVGDLVRLLDDRTSIVTASPYHPQGRVDGVPPFRLFLSRSLSRVYNLVLGSGLHTYTSMFRAYRRAALQAVPSHESGFIAVTHLLVFPILAGHRVVEHPAVLGGRRYGASKLRVLRVIREHLGLVGRIVLWRMRLRRRV
jgi:dolichol-phosphate mannosyltransferase